MRPQRLVITRDGLDVTGDGLAAECARAAGAMRTWGAAMPMGHACIFAHGMGLESTRLGRDTVDVHGAVATLSRDILVERVPGYTLNIVGVFSNFVDAFSCY